MKICVISGSPKGEYSITYQSAKYLQLNYPQDSFEVIHIGQQIKKAEKELDSYIKPLTEADLLLFCYPVYTFIAPYQLHRFIELVIASGVNLEGKYCAQLTTSKHFYDVTAHNYIRENALDMGLRYLGGLSADMDDLLTEKGRRELMSFWELVHFRAENNVFETASSISAPQPKPYISSGITSEKKDGNEAVIVANIENGDDELISMVEDFRAQYPHKTKLVNLREFSFSGGCLGCFNCATTGKCVYKDGFDDFLRNEIQTGSAIIYAFRIKEHSMGARMKLYDDRQFCNGHRTVTAGIPMGYLVLGNLDAEPNLKMIIEGRAQVGGNFLAGVATDVNGVTSLVRSLEFAIDNKISQPANFLGVGGMKIFRDLIWIMQGMMKADHKFYKEHGFYDFPQKQKGTILKMKLVGMLLSNPKIKAKMGNAMNDGMIMPYKKLFEDMKK